MWQWWIHALGLNPPTYAYDRRMACHTPMMYVMCDRAQSSSGTIKIMASWGQIPRDWLPQSLPRQLSSQNYSSNSIDGFDGWLIDAFTCTVLQSHFWLRKTVESQGQIVCGLNHYFLSWRVASSSGTLHSWPFSLKCFAKLEVALQNYASISID